MVSGVTSDARAAERLGLETAFAPSAPQIEFNAWHYVDANLWASLVTHIFSELSFQLFGRKASTEVLSARLNVPAWCGAGALLVAVLLGERTFSTLLGYGLAGFAAGAAPAIGNRST